MSFNGKKWQVIPLEDAVEALIDYRGKTPKKTDSGIPLITAKIVKSGRIETPTEFIADEDYDSWMTRGLPKVGDVVLTTEAPLGEVAQLDSAKVALAQRIVTLRGKSGFLDNDFLLYLVQSSYVQNQLESRASGSTVRGIKQSELRKVTLLVPPFEEQKWIASQIKSLDKKIEINRQINQTLEQMAQAIFQSWFVDFEPVKAKIAAREDWLARQAAQSDAHDDAPQFSSPVCYAHEFADAAAPAPATQADLETFMNRAAMCAISGKTDADLDAMPAADYQRLYHTASLFPDELVESELGEIPKGWEVKALDQIANYQNGLALQKFRPEDGEDYLPVVKIAQLKKGYADGEERASANITEKCIIDTGDVVFSWSGSLEVDIWCGGRAALNQHLFKVTSNTYPRWFYYLYTRHHLEDFQRIAKDKAVTMGHIKREHLSSAYCAISKNDLLGECDKAISALVDKTILNRVEINNLENIRDSLLPKLLSGELNCSTLTD